MASYLNPQPSNAILDDIINIRDLANYNAQSDPSLGADAPVGAKRFVNIGTATAPQWQWQRFNGSTWVAIAATTTEKLSHNVDMLDGYHASTSAVAGAIPVYNANKLLVGGITGNAATATKLATARNLQVGGIASGDAKSFNGTAAVTLPINSINVNNAEDDAIDGILTPAHGGTGRTDGASQDVRVDSLAGEVSAKAYGQIGRAKALGSSHLDSVVVDGFYVGDQGSSSHLISNGYPEHYTTAPCTLRVITNGNYCFQYYECNSLLWARRSTNSGATWTAWEAQGGTVKGSIALYVSKSGSDLNTGFSNQYPLLTIERAFQIFDALGFGATDRRCELRVGEGSWGSINLNNKSYRIRITNFSADVVTEFSESLPKFTQISALRSFVEISCIQADGIDATQSAYVRLIGGLSRLGYLRSRYNATLEITYEGVFEIFSQETSTEAFFRAYHGGRFDVAQTTTVFRVIDNLSFSKGFGYLTSNANLVDVGLSFEVPEGITVSGYGMVLANTAKYNGATSGITQLDKFPGTLGKLVYSGALINNVPYGGGDTSMFLRADGTFSNDVVHLTGDETIAGTKTFTDHVWISHRDPRLRIKNTTLTQGIVPSGNEPSAFQFYDSQDNEIGTIVHRWRANGETQMFFQIGTDINGATVSANSRYFGFGYSPTDPSLCTGFAPSTPDGCIANQIVTADWLYNRGLAETTVYANYDPDTLVKTGYYQIRNDKGKLPSGTNGCLLVYSTGAVVRQIFFRQGTIDSNDHNIYTRQLGGFVDGLPTTFGDWVQILTGKGGTIKGSGPILSFNNLAVEKGTISGTRTYGEIRFNDQNADRLGIVSSVVQANGNIETWIGAYKHTTSTTYAVLAVIYPLEGSPYACCPSPVATSNANHIATTEWVRARSTATSCDWGGGIVSHEIDTYYTAEVSGFLWVGANVTTSNHEIRLQMTTPDGKSRDYEIMHSYNSASNNGRVAIPIPAGTVWRIARDSSSATTSYIIRFMPNMVA